MAKKTIVLLGCFDTKGEPYGWLRDRIASKGIDTLLDDISVAGEPRIEPDISASEIASAAGTDLERLGYVNGVELFADGGVAQY